MSGRELPSTWVCCEFGDIAKVASDLVDPQLTPDSPHVAPNHVSSWTGELIEKSTIRDDDVTSPKHRFRTGQIVYSKIRPYLAKAILADFDGLCSADMYPIDSEIDAHFLLRWMLSKEFTETAARSQGRTVLPKINQESLQKILVPVPPLSEQRRIAKKIEALTARSRRAREALDSLPALIDRYRQSILAAAFRGDLTADWRYANGQDIGVQAEHDESLPPIPKSWRWVRLPELGTVGRGKSRHRPRNDPRLFGGDYPFIQTGNVSAATGTLLKYDITYNDFGLQQSKLWPKGTVCITIAANIAETAVLGIDACFPDSVAGVIVDESMSSPQYVEYFLRTAKKNLERFAPATAQKNINLETLQGVYVPLPPKAEQEALLKAIDRSLNTIERIELLTSKSNVRLATLDQSILAKAFRGELVPQDPNDEPASVLLERIRAERAAAGTAPRRGRRAKA